MSEVNQQTRRIRRAAFESAVAKAWDPKAVAKAGKCSKRIAEVIGLEMEREGIPKAGAIEFLTTAQAAWVLGVIERRVRGFCSEGRLGQKIGGRFIISAGDVLRFSSIPRPVGGAGVKVLAATRAGKGDGNGADSDDRGE